jgi:hypothetical protein
MAGHEEDALDSAVNFGFVTNERPDPFTLPEWHALRREAILVSQLIGSGVTALGRASYADRLGEYYTAFFGLSIGIERLAKLILVADYAMEHGGNLPDQAVVKRFGHHLRALSESADQAANQHALTLEFPKPTDPICWAAVECLDAFADASRGRYANFEAIGNTNFDPSNEPVNRWWTKVVEPILDNHYRGKSAEAGVRERAAVINAMIGSSSLVLNVNEEGVMMTDIATSSERTGQTVWAQKYGRFYTLSIVRWLSDIFDQLVHEGAYGRKIDALSGHNEFFKTYRASDSFLLTRKLWPLK